MFQFDGTQLDFIDPGDLTKAGIYPMKAYARYDGTDGGDSTHYTQYATLDITVILVDMCEVGTLTILPSIFPDGSQIVYNIEDPAY